MKNILKPTLAVLLLFVSLLLPALPAVAAEVSSERLLEIGRTLYLQGLLADGSPSRAIALGDVEVPGDQFSCLNCHRRSGLGGAEGQQLVLAINGPSLLSPRVNLRLARPAYTFDSFIEAMMSGVNPNGEPFDPIMPKYDLPDLEAQALFAYLQTLSSQYPPGVDENTLHLATVIGPGVSPSQRQEMLTILQAYFSDKNAGIRNEKGRQRSGPFYLENRNKAYKTWELHIWELSGPASGWAEQMDAYYRKQPVFALLSGMTASDWAPIDAYCEARKIPCVLPNTRMPLVEDSPGFYTMYYSKGLVLDAEVLGTEIQHKGLTQVVTLARQGTDGERGQEALLALPLQPGVSVTPLTLSGDPQEWEALRPQLEKLQPDALILWLNSADVNRFATEYAQGSGAASLYFSSTLLDGNLEAIPETLRAAAQVVHPYVLPEKQKPRLLQTTSWMKKHHIELTNPLVQGQTFYSCLLLTGSLKHMRQNFYRDYLLDTLDHRDNMAIYSGNYPRLSFGPEQRFLAKGAYLVELKTNTAQWKVPGL